MTDTAPLPAPRRSTALKALLIIDTIGLIFTIPIGLVWGFMSAMSSTITNQQTWVELYVIANLAIPALFVVSVIAGWIAFALRRERLAWWILFTPLIPLVLSVGMCATWPQT